MFLNFLRSLILPLFFFFIFFIFLTKYRKNIINYIYTVLKTVWPRKNRIIKNKQYNVIFNTKLSKFNNGLAQAPVKGALPFHFDNMPPTSLDVGGICGILKERHNNKNYKNNLLKQLNNTFKMSRNYVYKRYNTSGLRATLYPKYYKQHIQHALDVKYLILFNLRKPICDKSIWLPDTKQNLTNIQIEKALLFLNLYKQKKYPKEKNLIINILQNN